MLRERGYLAAQGRGRGTHYRLARRHAGLVDAAVLTEDDVRVDEESVRLRLIALVFKEMNRDGEVVTVTNRGRPVAVLSPVPASEETHSAFVGMMRVRWPGVAPLNEVRTWISSHRESFNLSAKVPFCIEGGHRRSGNVGESGEIEPWNLLLVREHDDRLERQTVKQEVRQHDGREPYLVAARNAVEEHGSPVAAGKVVAARHVCRHGRNRRHARS